MRIALYAHGGSGNHGCEALVRSTIKVLGSHEYIIMSENAQEDFKYDLNKLALIKSSHLPLRKGFHRLWYSINMKLQHKDCIYYNEIYRDFTNQLGNCDLALAIGGDNYCYKGLWERFSILNNMLKRQSIPTILWGCSIDPERINNNMLEDLSSYRIITARETITYKSLISHGLSNVRLIPDTAFCLDMKHKCIPLAIKGSDFVGINISPLIIKHEPLPGITIENYKCLISYVLEKTSLSVLLIPHVVWKENDDRQPLLQLYHIFNHTNRIALIEDADAEVLKGYISQCRFLIAARTHASIAAYSTGVPTLVIGYSTKAKGIAQDLFGDSSHFVIDISSIRTPNKISKSFQWIMQHENSIRDFSKTIIEQYKTPLYQLDNIIKEACHSYKV